MNRSGEKLFWQNLDSEARRRIISAANRNTLCRVIVIAYLAGFLFFCHIRQYLLTDPKRKIACVLSSVLLIFYVTTNQAALVVRGESVGYQEGMQLEDTQKENENQPDAGQDQDVEQEEKPQIDIDVIVTEPEEDIVEGYEERPVYQVRITNNGTDVLNNIILQSQTADVFILHKEVEVLVYHPQEEKPDEAEKSDGTEDVEDGQDTEDTESEDAETSEDGRDTEESEDSLPVEADQKEETSDAEQLPPEIPTVLESGQSFTYMIYMPLALLAGEYTELLSFYAEELDRPVETLLCLKVLEVSSGHDSDQGNLNDETDSEKQEGNSQNPEDAEVESPETGSEEITAEDETNSEGAEEAGETEEKEPQDSILLPTVEVTAREGGYYMGNTFFVTAASNFEVKATNAHVLSNGSVVYGSSIKAVFCELNGTIQELEIKDGSAVAVLPESYHGEIKFYAVDESGCYSNEIREYVISEKNVPTVDYAKVVSATDGSEQIRITLKDTGEIISGISETECYIDGKRYTEYKAEVFEKQMLSGGMEVSSGIFFDIPLMDHEVHTIEVCVTDHTGNSFVKVFRVCATQSDVVSVVLPTHFGMEIFPSAANGNIFGEDIVIANQSDFPVEVTLAAANVGINHELPENRIMTSELMVGNDFRQPFDLTEFQSAVKKDAALNLNLKKVDGDETVFALQEGTNSNVVRFTLQPKNPDTNAVALQREQKGEPVSSGDYAIANIRGVISEGSERMWKDGDITVSLTFTFRKLEESE